jgi:three-Cys-motif partner protein
MEDIRAEVQHLKQVSRIKHQILTGYLPPWARILGSAFDLLYYVDCFAGPGQYESSDKIVDGSPIIAVKAAKEFATKYSKKKLGLILIEDDPDQLKHLETCLRATLPHPDNLKVQTRLADSHTIIPGIIDQISKRKMLRVSSSWILTDIPYRFRL